MYYGRGGGFLSRMKDRIIRFMSGRNGRDELSNFLFGVWIALAIANLFLDLIAVSVVTLCIAIYIIFRIMSRNIYKRQAENRKFMAIRGKIKSKTDLMSNKWRDRKTHIYKNAPHVRAISDYRGKKALTR